MTDSFSVGLSGVKVGASNPAGTYKFWSNYNRAFVLTPEWSNAGPTSTRTVSISSKFVDSGGGLLTATANEYAVAAYEDNSVSSDIQIFNGSTGNDSQRPYIDWIDDETTRATGFIYANSLNNVTVKNCSGKIYIRGF